MKKGDKKRTKALLWSLMWANVVMLLVMVGTYFAVNYLYNSMKSYVVVLVNTDISAIIIAYIIGMLILWAIIYKYMVSEPVYKEDPHQNHNIY